MGGDQGHLNFFQTEIVLMMADCLNILLPIYHRLSMIYKVASSPAVKHEFRKLGFNDLGLNDLIFTTLRFNYPWIQQPLDSITLGFNNKKFSNTHLQ